MVYLNELIAFGEARCSTTHYGGDVVMYPKSHDTRTRDTEDTKIRVFDTRHDDPGNRTHGTCFIYIYIKNFIYILKKYINIYIF